MSVWERLLAVQERDTAIEQLNHRRARLPERDELTEAQARLATLDAERRVQADQRDELARTQNRIEDEIASFSEKRESVNRQLYGGSGQTPKELGALQSEIEAIGRKIRALEDQELEIMEQIEPVEARLAALDAESAELDATVLRLIAAIAEAEVEIDSELEAERAGRLEALSSVDDAAAVDLYESHRSTMGGTAIARLTSGVCGACHLGLSAVEKDRIKHLDVDAEVRCEECGRFLVRD